MKFKLRLPNDDEPKIILSPLAEHGILFKKFCNYFKKKEYKIAGNIKKTSVSEVRELITEFRLYDGFTTPELLQEKYMNSAWYAQSIQAFLQLKKYGNKTIYVLPETHMHINQQEQWIDVVFNKCVDCLILTHSPDIIGAYGAHVYEFELIDRTNPTKMELEIEIW